MRMDSVRVLAALSDRARPVDMDSLERSGQRRPGAAGSRTDRLGNTQFESMALRILTGTHPWGFSHDSSFAHGARCCELVIFPPTITGPQRLAIGLERVADALGAGSGLLVAMVMVRSSESVWLVFATATAGWLLVALPLHLTTRRLRERVGHLVAWQTMSDEHVWDVSSDSELFLYCRQELEQLRDKDADSEFYRARWTSMYEAVITATESSPISTADPR